MPSRPAIAQGLITLTSTRPKPSAQRQGALRSRCDRRFKPASWGTQVDELPLTRTSVSMHPSGGGRRYWIAPLGGHGSRLQGKFEHSRGAKDEQPKGLVNFEGTQNGRQQ